MKSQVPVTTLTNTSALSHVPCFPRSQVYPCSLAQPELRSIQTTSKHHAAQLSYSNKDQSTETSAHISTTSCRHDAHAYPSMRIRNWRCAQPLELWPAQVPIQSTPSETTIRNPRRHSSKHPSAESSHACMAPGLLAHRQIQCQVQPSKTNAWSCPKISNHQQPNAGGMSPSNGERVMCCTSPEGAASRELRAAVHTQHTHGPTNQPTNQTPNTFAILHAATSDQT